MHTGENRGLPICRAVGWAAVMLLLAGNGSRLLAQYDKVAALQSDTSLTPIGGYASAPEIQTLPYNLPDLRPTGMLNDVLPPWLKFGVEERLRWEGYSNSGFKPGNNDSYLLNRMRVGMIISPVSWLKVIAQTQDARPFFQKPPYGPPNENRWDLKLAYVQIGNPESSPVSVKVGRQELDFNNTILANSEWRNQGRSYDAVTTYLHVDRFRAAVFAASVVSPLASGISHHQEGNNIYGVYGAIDRTIPKSAIEPFVLWRVNPSVAVEDAKVKTGHEDEKAYGIRLRGREIANFDYRTEVIFERGSVGPNSISAWATTSGAGYRIPKLAWKPRLFTGYDYASGDKTSKDGVRNTFDTMYPTAHDRFGITDQFGWQNIVAGRGGVSVEPFRRWSFTAQYLDFWIASATDGIYNTSGGLIARDSTGRSGTHIGDEFDAYTWYEVNREIHVGAGVGHIFPGEFLAKVTKGAAYTYPYFAVEFLDGKRVH